MLSDLGSLEVALGRDSGYADSSHSDAICLLQSQLAWQRDLTHLLHFVLTRTHLLAAVTARQSPRLWLPVARQLYVFGSLAIALTNNNVSLLVGLDRTLSAEISLPHTRLMVLLLAQ